MVVRAIIGNFKSRKTSSEWALGQVVFDTNKLPLKKGKRVAVRFIEYYKFGFYRFY
jgi:hypothetical protein